MSVDRIGAIMAKLHGATPDYSPPPAQCGGAMLYVSRDQAMKMVERGFRWKLDPVRMPLEGKHQWRVACSADVMTVARTAELPEEATDEDRRKAPRYLVTYGLCSRCNGYEIAMRKKLREWAAKEADEAKGKRGGKRGFRETAEDP